MSNLACPNTTWKMGTSIGCSSRCLAKLCRKVCGAIQLVRPAHSADFVPRRSGLTGFSYHSPGAPVLRAEVANPSILKTSHPPCGRQCVNWLLLCSPPAAARTDQRLSSRPRARHLGARAARLAPADLRTPASHLLRLETAETKPNIRNNTIGEFKHIFLLQLSGTRAEPAKRLVLLDEGPR